jgi:hypothetical protein
MISPSKFEFSLDRRYTNFFTVTNTSEQTTSIRIYSQSVRISDANQVVEKAGAPGDMTEWVVINPRRITLGPQEKRVVRFSVRAPEKLEPGEYNTFLFFEELPAPAEEEVGTDKPQGSGVRLNLLSRLGAGIWGHSGQLQYKIGLEPGTADWPKERLEYSGSLANRGNAHVTVAVEASLLDGDGKAVRQWQGNMVLFRGDVRHLQFDWKRPVPGTYALRLSVSGEQVPAAETHVAVTVPRAEGN